MQEVGNPIEFQHRGGLDNVAEVLRKVAEHSRSEPLWRTTQAVVVVAAETNERRMSRTAVAADISRCIALSSAVHFVGMLDPSRIAAVKRTPSRTHPPSVGIRSPRHVSVT